ncbi:probable RNA-dependent RNA polymerase 4 [Miscanthus floridulus]|uniref:probable RNA-dependent RNA polymerase 4 n=1 Tax=Miscanthus floridulus TaxID=154761 RepID=UPI00345778B6
MLVPQPGGVLPDAVEAELEGLCAAWGAEPYPGSPAARAALASVDAGAAVRALRRVAARGRRGPSGRTADSETLASAIVRAVAEGSSSDGKQLMGCGACQSTVGIFNQAASVPSWVLNNPAQTIYVRLEQTAPSGRFLAATPLNLEVGKPQKASSGSQNASAGSLNASPQMLALGQLEFSKVFMIFGYLGCNKIEDVLNEEDIRSLKFLSMPHFESEIWHKFGHKYVAASDRVKLCFDIVKKYQA